MDFSRFRNCLLAFDKAGGVLGIGLGVGSLCLISTHIEGKYGKKVYIRSLFSMDR